MSQPVCRWGFLGAANIARKNWKAVRMSGNSVVKAVASRDLDRAEAFIQECSMEVPPVIATDGVPSLQRPQAFGDYQEMIERDDIDVIYVALPTAVRKQWVIAAAKAGKHVVCEKPVAVNAEDAAEMVAACTDSGVGFIDGVMFDHSARLPMVVQQIHGSEELGRLRRIQSHFSFCGDEGFYERDIRTRFDLEPHGCLGDLGWYCIRLTLRLMRGVLPVSVSGHTLASVDDGRVPIEFRGEMQFPEVSAGFFCSFRTANQQTMWVSGESGTLTMDDFVLPYYDSECKWQVHRPELQIDNCRWNFGRHTAHFAVHEHAGGEEDSQEVNLVRRFAQSALDGTPDPADAEIALATQRVLDAMRRSDASGGKIVDL
ncbi:MAG: Gfo/Idh/MocA family oxidoreductase [Planctomycetota bacterium]